MVEKAEKYKAEVDYWTHKSKDTKWVLIVEMKEASNQEEVAEAMRLMVACGLGGPNQNGGVGITYRLTLLLVII